MFLWLQCGWSVYLKVFSSTQWNRRWDQCKIVGYANILWGTLRKHCAWRGQTLLQNVERRQPFCPPVRWAGARVEDRCHYAVDVSSPCSSRSPGQVQSHISRRSWTGAWVWGDNAACIGSADHLRDSGRRPQADVSGRLLSESQREEVPRLAVGETVCPLPEVGSASAQLQHDHAPPQLQNVRRNPRFSVGRFLPAQTVSGRVTNPQAVGHFRRSQDAQFLLHGRRWGGWWLLVFQCGRNWGSNAYSCEVPGHCATTARHLRCILLFVTGMPKVVFFGSN